MTKKNVPSLFARFATWSSHATGHPKAFFLAVVIIIAWGVTGPIFGFSDTWQLLINTSTTILTFLMVFVIQNTQNRDSTATQLKLDEIIRSINNANNALLNMEQLDEKELEKIRARYIKLAEEAQKFMRKPKSDK
ncbi:MAG: low affinity iron permease family protein [Actinomycetota bacterium]